MSKLIYNPFVVFPSRRALLLLFSLAFFFMAQFSGAVPVDPARTMAGPKSIVNRLHPKYLDYNSIGRIWLDGVQSKIRVQDQAFDQIFETGYLEDGFGSGTVISPCLVLTNDHVTKGVSKELLEKTQKKYLELRTQFSHLIAPVFEALISVKKITFQVWQSAWNPTTDSEAFQYSFNGTVVGSGIDPEIFISRNPKQGPHDSLIREQDHRDWSVLLLDHPLPDKIKPLTPMAINSEKFKDCDQIVMAGYGGETHQLKSPQVCKLIFSGQERKALASKTGFSIDCEAERGTSGGAVFCISGSRAYFVGIPTIVSPLEEDEKPLDWPTQEPATPNPAAPKAQKTFVVTFKNNPEIGAIMNKYKTCPR